MDEFPKLLYRAPGPHEIHGGMFDHITVDDAEQESSALKQGWRLTTTEAREDFEQAEQERKAAEAKRTGQREDLERQATELGITFTPRTSDKKLAAEIAEKRAQG